MFPAKFAMVYWSFSSRVLTLTFGMMFFLICLGLLTVGSSQVQTQKWKQLQLATNHVWNRMLDFWGARCWERVQSFDWAMHFFWWGWRWRWGLGLLTVGSSQVQTPNWKESVQAGNKSRLEQNAGFFLWQEVGKESSLLTGLCIFVWWGWRWDPTDNLHVFFGFLWACWRWVPHRSQNQNWEETIVLKDRAQYCTMNIILHAHLHRTRTTHIIFKLVLQSR